MTARGVDERTAVNVVNELLQSVPVGTIGVAFEAPGVRRALEAYETNLAAWMRPKRVTKRIALRLPGDEPEIDATP